MIECDKIKHMGKAKKLKKLRKIEKIKEMEENQKKKKRQAAYFMLGLFLLVIIIWGIAVFIKYARERDVIKAVIETEKGNIEINLYPKAAPKTVDNFVKLVEEGFYNGTTFHRVVENFIIQGGDPLSKDDDPSNDGTGGPGYTFDDEINPVSLGLTIDQVKELEKQGYKYRYDIKSIPHEPGVISMANSGPNTNGSQFFIVISKEPQHYLDGRYTAFGRVSKGLDVARKIKQGDKINRIYIKK